MNDFKHGHWWPGFNGLADKELNVMQHNTNQPNFILNIQQIRKLSGVYFFTKIALTLLGSLRFEIILSGVVYRRRSPSDYSWY